MKVQKPYSRVFARACVCVFVARFCGVLGRFESGFERKIQKGALSVGKKMFL